VPKKNIIIIGDMRALPISAALSISKKFKKSGVEFWISENSLKYNDYGQYDEAYTKKIKLQFLKLFGKVQIFSSTVGDLDFFNTGIESSLKSITNDSMATKETYKDIWNQLFELSRGAFSIAKQIKKDIHRVFIFNGRLASSYSISKICIQNNVDTFFYEYSKLDNKFRILPFPTHNLPMLSKAILQKYKYSIAGENQFYSKGIGYISEKLTNKFVANYLSLSEKSYDVVIFLSSPHEYKSLDYEICGISYQDEVKFISKVIEKYGESKKYAVRCHPNQKNDPSWEIYFAKLTQFCIDRKIDFYTPVNSVSSYDLVRRSDNVVVDISSIGLDAFFLGSNVEVFGAPAYKDAMLYVRGRKDIDANDKKALLGGMLSNFDEMSSMDLSLPGRCIYLIFRLLEKLTYKRSH
jgi:hypothetical protein